MASRRTFIALCGGAALGFAGTTSAANSVSSGEQLWPMFQGDVRNTGAVTGRDLPVTKPEEDWRYGLEGHTVVVGDDRVFVLDDSQLAVIDAETGVLEWEYDSPPSQGMALYDGSVLVGGPTGLVSLSVGDGTEQWEYEQTVVTEMPRGHHTIADHVAYFPTREGLAAIEVDDGSERWERETDEFIDTVPAVWEDWVFVVTQSRLVAFDRETGDREWQTGVGGVRNNAFSPVIDDGLIYLIDGDGAGSRGSATTLQARDARRGGAVVWETEGAAFTDSSPVVTDDTVYVVGPDRESLRAYDAREGELLWQSDEPPEMHIRELGTVSPVLVDSTVYVASDDTLYAFDASDGAALWEHETGGTIDPGIAPGDTQLYVADTDAVVALEEGAAEPSATFETPAAPVQVGETVQLAAGESTSGGDTIVEYRWQIAETELFGQQVEYTFDDPGEHDITLQVTTEHDRTDTQTHTVTVDLPPEPEASITIDPEQPSVGETVELDGTESEQPNTELTAYDWQIDAEQRSGAVIEYIFPSAGEYTVELRVTDEFDREATTERVTSVVEQASDTADESDPGLDQDDADADVDDTDETPDDADDSTQAADDDGPGFGVGETLASVGGIAYLLKRKLSSTEADPE